MDSINILYLILALLCLMASAFFSSSETAFISLQKIRLKHMESQGVPRAGRVAKILEKPERFISTILLGNNFVNTTAAALGTAIAISIWGNEGKAVLVATAVVTITLLVMGEVVPKIVGAQHSERIALLYVSPVTALSWVLSPAVTVLEWIGNTASKVIGGAPTHRAIITEEEIRTMISVGKDEGVVGEAEAKMLHNVFEFGDLSIEEVTIPRTDVVWVAKGTTVADFLKVYSQYPHTRFPVYEETTDNVVGALSIKDLLMARAKGEIGEESAIDGLVRPVIFAPETKRIGPLFAEMQAKGNQMAVVVDEYGGISGIVTLKQLLAQVVGRFGDELTKLSQEFKAIDEHTYEVDGGMRIEEVNETTGLDLPGGDYETIAGLLLHRLGHIPHQGEQLRSGNLRLVVKELKGLKIERVRIIKEGEQAPGG
ncbi:MAG: HlyC/CorC family transporter [Chloroflexi bacterium]|nr:HlyC/CorC family transporter [Chloroflexota bacterium]